MNTFPSGYDVLKIQSSNLLSLTIFYNHFGSREDTDKSPTKRYIKKV